MASGIKSKLLHSRMKQSGKGSFIPAGCTKALKLYLFCSGSINLNFGIPLHADNFQGEGIHLLSYKIYMMALINLSYSEP